jgi:peptidylprolyl isomerase
MVKRLLIGLGIVLGIVALGLGLQYLAPPQSAPLDTQTVSTTASPNIPAGEPGELQVEDIVVGDGAEVTSGDTVVMHYTGTFEDGTKFDSSYDRNKPFETPIGKGAVIQGWDEGVPGMRVGGKRKLIIPYNLGYGENGSPPAIPPKATLIFEVELLEIK